MISSTHLFIVSFKVRDDVRVGFKSVLIYSFWFLRPLFLLLFQIIIQYRDGQKHIPWLLVKTWSQLMNRMINETFFCCKVERVQFGNLEYGYCQLQIHTYELYEKSSPVEVQSSLQITYNNNAKDNNKSDQTVWWPIVILGVYYTQIRA